MLLLTAALMLPLFTHDHVLDLYKDDSYLKDRVSIYRYLISPDNIWDWVWNINPVKAPATILDVGTGLGSYWQQNSSKLPDGCTLFLTDISAAMLEATAQNNPLLFQKAATHYAIANVEQLPFDDAAYDQVFCHFVLFYTGNYQKALSELKRVTKPGGIVSIITLNSDYCRPLYELAHQLDARFPQNDTATEQFDENRADMVMKDYFSTYEKYIFKREIKFTPGADLKPFLRSVARGYQIPLTAAMEDEYQALFDAALSAGKELNCFSQSALYICHI